MKIGMNLLLWTGNVTEEHVPLLKALKETGFDGVEIPIFDPSDVSRFARLGGVLDDLGLQRTSVSLIPDEAHSPISADASARQAGADHLSRVIDCCRSAGRAGAGRAVVPAARRLFGPGPNRGRA